MGCTRHKPPLLLERAGVRRIKSTSYIPLIPTFSLKGEHSEGSGTGTCVDSYALRERAGVRGFKKAQTVTVHSIHIGWLLLSMLFFMTGCSISPRQPALHDFGYPATIPAAKTLPAISVDAPTWLWDNRIRYRQLYASRTRVGFYALDRWLAPPPELFEQSLMAAGNTGNYSLIIRLQDFEQQFDAPGKSKVVLRFSATAYTGDPKRAIGAQEFYLEWPAATPDAAGAVGGFAALTRQAADKLQGWLAGLADK